MGGGSMNAAHILKYLSNKQKLNLSSKEILRIASKIGSDVVVGMQNKTSILYGSGEIKLLKKNINLFTLLVKPNLGCLTKAIYRDVRYFSRPVFKKNQRVNLNYKFLIKLKNDLEEPAFKKYPVLKKLKIFMEKMDDILFVRMTGSGSTIIGYFISKKAAINAGKILKKKYQKYWCILSKTI
jgi:4-diphosphocytidyl-2-C-methyl-D-erythritol kinase